MKKGCLYSLGAIIIIIVTIFLSLYLFTMSLIPPKQKTLVDMKNPNHVIAQLTDRIDIQKNKLNSNYKRLSNVDWCHYDMKKFKLSDIFAEINDSYIRSANEQIIYYLQQDYAMRAAIKKNKFHDQKGASADLDEFEKLVKKNNYISNYKETIDFIKSFR